VLFATLLAAQSLAALLGEAERPALVQVWAPWCKSCAGVTAEVKAVLAEAPGVPYIVANVDEARGKAIAQAAGDAPVPSVLVVDKNGNIVARIAGHFGSAQRGELTAKLAEVRR